MSAANWSAHFRRVPGARRDGLGLLTSDTRNDMVHRWKIKRELSRIGGQITGLPRTLARLPSRLREPSRRRAHDAAFPGNLQVHAGSVAASKRVAVYVLYQPQGVSRSTFDTCGWLSSTGQAPIVISNAPLVARDREALRSCAWQVVERENFGYDFGAYRDGIGLARLGAPDAERLLLLNDSVWLFASDDLDRQVLAVDADLVGLLQDEKVAHDAAGSRATDKVYVESYFLSISRALLHSDLFRRFWSDYQMTDDKPATVRRGELGWSRTVQQGGFRLGSVSRRAVFLERLAGIGTPELRLALDYAAYDDEAYVVQNQLLRERYEAGDAWREAALAHVVGWVHRRRFNAGFPVLNEWIFGGTLCLKKSREPIFERMRRAYLRAVSDGLLRPPPTHILPEIEQTVRARRN